MNTKRSHLLKAAFVGLVSAALPLAASAMSMNRQDQTFVMKASQAGMAEVQLAALALQKSKNPHVIAFANEMHGDHTKANTQLMTILTSQGITPPSGVGAANQALAAELKAQSGSAFDSRYLKSQLPAHQHVLALFQTEASSGSDRKLIAFAKQTIPVIESHIAMDKRDIASLRSGMTSSDM